MPAARGRRALLPVSCVTVVIGGWIATSTPSVRAQASLAALDAAYDALVQRLPAQPVRSDDTPVRSLGRFAESSTRGGRSRSPGYCATVEGNPLSPLVAEEDNPRAHALNGFVHRDTRGRHTRPWRARTRAALWARAQEVQRPLLVFLETPPSREDPTQPWLGPVRFDRPGFYTSKAQITEQIFGKDFDYRDPASVAGFYYRESGGRLVIRGDASSVHTVTVPFIPFDPQPMMDAILEQLDPVVDFTRRADDMGWVHPIFIVTAFSHTLDVRDPAVQGALDYWGYGPPAYTVRPSITNDAFADGTHAALGSLAIAMVGSDFGANEDPEDPWFGLSDAQVRSDSMMLYAHEYGHAIGMSHMMIGDFDFDTDDRTGTSIANVTRPDPASLSRGQGTGFASSIMNYSVTFPQIADPAWTGKRWSAGLDPINRAKLGWGHVTEIAIAAPDAAHGRRALPPQGTLVQLVEHLGTSAADRRPQILKINLPGGRETLFPATGDDGSPTGYWRPGHAGRRMVWSGRSEGGSRFMQTSLRVPSDLARPVLSFWTKYGAHSGWLMPEGYEFGWVQISTNGGRTWTSLAGTTSSTYVAPDRAALQWMGDDLGAPAFTGDSRLLSDTGWIFEQIPLPVARGTSLLLRFNYSGDIWSGPTPAQDLGWWIDDVSLGSASDPMRYAISDFEGPDASRWSGLLERFDRGIGFTVVEETASFPRAYFFELRGHNDHDAELFQRVAPRSVTTRVSALGEYAYEPGLVGYFADQYATFWSGVPFFSGSPNERPVPLHRLKQRDISYPYAPQGSLINLWDIAWLLGLAFDPQTGVTLDDVAYLLAFPSEESYEIYNEGFAYLAQGQYPDPPAVTILDATPTYRLADLSPASPWTPFPDRPVRLWPFIVGPTGGWPKSMRHGLLGDRDPTTTSVLGQPFLARDAAFHPDRNAVFDDEVDYRGLFAGEFANAHAQATAAAFGGLVPAERRYSVPRALTDVISTFDVFFCYETPAGTCGPRETAMQRPWVEEVIYHRMRRAVFASVSAGCPPEPANTTPAALPLWEAHHACFQWAFDTSHTLGTELLNRARNLGNNPAYAFLNAWGTNGIVSPELWTAQYLQYWSLAKGPAALPSYGLSVTVESISRHGTPVANVRVRQSDTPRSAPRWPQRPRWRHSRR